MKSFTLIRLFLLSVVTGHWQLFEARIDCSILQERIDSLINPPLLKQAGQILRFDRTLLNIGTLTEDDAPKTYRFMCTNLSGKTLNLTRVKTTCGCVVADIQSGDILPGGTKVIELTYNPNNHPGTIDANAFVYLSLSDEKPVARLILRGNVLPSADEWARYPYIMGKLRLKQNRMEFKISGKRLSERILCGNSGEQELRLSASSVPKFATFRTEPEVISPGGEADVVVTIDASQIPSGKGSSFTFSIIIEGIDVPQSDRILNIRVNRIE
ncbi:DUF1573 domain-containing protein [Bacteroides congonensis]|uniref:DUF1573 domain-containing protein n=1 Tax=Bacteroides congonensis TaxID=1871006 RepID=UPI001899D156|nr:DUF1573 domain-containing protein [Bacteroides congonensis]